MNRSADPATGPAARDLRRRKACALCQIFGFLDRERRRDTERSVLEDQRVAREQARDEPLVLGLRDKLGDGGDELALAGTVGLAEGLGQHHALGIHQR